MAIEIKKHWTTLSEHEAFDHHGNSYSVAELNDKAKSLPVIDMPLDHLCIGRDITDTDIRSFVSHMKMTLDADLDYPIILCIDGGIIDGAHRVARALLEGKETIRAIRLIEMPKAKK